MAVNGDKVLEGRLGNLAHANRVRAAKAQFKIDLGKLEQAEACRLLADKLVNEPSGVMGAMLIQEVLLSVNGIGKTKAVLLARAADRTALNVKVRDLPEFRRHELARVLRERANDVEGRSVAA